MVPLRRPVFAAVLASACAAPLALREGVSLHEAELPSVRLQYLRAGSGPPVVLLHGFGETSHMWGPVIEALARTHTVIAPDLRGFGGSSKPAQGYDKKTLAEDVHALVASLGFKHVDLAGHDIGLMVAYAYAAQHPDEVERLALLESFLPGVGDWKQAWLGPRRWHFHFHGPTAEQLVAGRERIYLEHFWNDFAADRTRSMSEADRELYTHLYAQDGAMHAAFETFRTLGQDAEDFAQFARRPLPMPILVLTGARAWGTFPIEQARLAGTQVEGVALEGCGHWLLDEARDETVRRLADFFSHPAPGATP